MTNEDRELDLIRSVLVEALSDECRRVGRANLNDIVRRRGDVRIAPVPGARMDYTLPLLALVSATTVLSHCLIIAQAILASDRDSRPPLIIDQSNRLSGVSQEGEGGQIRVSNQTILIGEIKLHLSPEVLERVDPAVADRLIALLVSRLHDERGGLGGSA